MKKSLRRGMILIIVAAMMLVQAAAPAQPVYAASAFKDVPANAWYVDSLTRITQDSRHILEGYGDGKFKPQGMLTVSEFVKCIIAARGISLPQGKTYWAQPYIDKAKELGYITGNEFASTVSDPYKAYKRQITRGEMARLVVRAMEDMEPGCKYRDEKTITPLIKDYARMQSIYKSWVVKAYDMGMLSGYPDGTFKADRGLTRAETVTVCLRMIDASAREKVTSVQPGTTPAGNPATSSGTNSGSGSKYKAAPDKDFETFMRSAEAAKYIYTEAIAEVKDGLIYFDTTVTIPDDEKRYSKRILPPDKYNPYANKEVYETTRDLVNLAKKYGGFVSVEFYPYTDTRSYVSIEYYEKKFTVKNRRNSGSMFSVEIWTEKPLEKFPGKQKEPITYRWQIGSLCTDDYLIKQGYLEDTSGDYSKYDFIEDRYVEIAQSMLMNIYGKKQGENLMKFSLEDAKLSWSNPSRTVDMCEYREDFGGCEFIYVRTKSFTTFVFYTSGVKVKR